MNIEGRKKKKKRELSKIEKEILMYVMLRFFDMNEYFDEDRHGCGAGFFLDFLYISERTQYRYLSDLYKSGLLPKIRIKERHTKAYEKFYGRVIERCITEIIAGKYYEGEAKISENGTAHLSRLKRLGVLIDCLYNSEENYFDFLEWNFSSMSCENRKNNMDPTQYISVKEYKDTLKKEAPELLKSDRTLERDIEMLKHLFNRIGPGKTEFQLRKILFKIQ